MNVLSLFDGMSCGQLALKKLGIEVDIYIASEIDKYAGEWLDCRCNSSHIKGDGMKDHYSGKVTRLELIIALVSWVTIHLLVAH